MLVVFVPVAFVHVIFVNDVGVDPFTTKFANVPVVALIKTPVAFVNVRFEIVPDVASKFVVVTDVAVKDVTVPFVAVKLTIVPFVANKLVVVALVVVVFPK